MKYLYQTVNINIRFGFSHGAIWFGWQVKTSIYSGPWWWLPIHHPHRGRTQCCFHCSGWDRNDWRSWLFERGRLAVTAILRTDVWTLRGNGHWVADCLCNALAWSLEVGPNLLCKPSQPDRHFWFSGFNSGLEPLSFWECLKRPCFMPSSKTSTPQESRPNHWSFSPRLSPAPSGHWQGNHHANVLFVA